MISSSILLEASSSSVSWAVLLAMSKETEMLLSHGMGSPAEPPGYVLLSSSNWEDTIIPTLMFLPLGLAWEF